MLRNRWLTLSIFMSVLALLGSLHVYLIFLTLLAPLAFFIAWINFTQHRKNLMAGAAVVLSAGSVLHLVSLVADMNVAATDAQAMVHEYYIPEGYHGWVIIEHDPTASPLSHEFEEGKSTYQHHIPTNGILKTSSPVKSPVGFMARYHFYDPSFIMVREGFQPNYLVNNEHMVRVGCEHGDDDYYAFYVFDKAYPANSDEVEDTCDSFKMPES